MQTQTLQAGQAGIAAAAAAPDGDGYASGTSWGAIVAGAAAATALTFILLILGVGLGLSTVSPYQYHAAPLAAASIGWIAFTQLAAAGIGGYMAGRLRVKWAAVHGDEVYFRDTAHGLLTWAVATLLMVAVMAGSARAVLSGAIDSANAVATAAAGNAGRANTYFADMLLRSPAGEVASESQRSEINRILMADLAAGKISPDDRSYLAQLIAQRTGLAPADAERRVDQVYAQAAQAIEQARAAAARSALWMFVALLLGAFVAAISALAGGRRRDHARVHV